MAKTASKRTYPWKTNVKDTSVTLRLMTPEDNDEMQAFALSLPEDDLLFLSIDITKSEAVKELARNIELGRLNTIFVELNGKLVGHGSLMHDNLQWTRHLGEMILLISPEMRGKGLGHLLASELFGIAKELGLRKVVARMASSQRGAIQVFERLGFKPEALLTDYVIDRKNRTHDLIVMSYDLTGFTEE